MLPGRFGFVGVDSGSLVGFFEFFETNVDSSLIAHAVTFFVQDNTKPRGAKNAAACLLVMVGG
jgi:hypothetical protein